MRPLLVLLRGDRHDCREALRQLISEAGRDLGPRLPGRLGLRQAGGPPGGLPRKVPVRTGWPRPGTGFVAPRCLGSLLALQMILDPAEGLAPRR